MIQLRIAQPLLVGLPAVLLLATGCPELLEDDFGTLQSDPARPEHLGRHERRVGARTIGFSVNVRESHRIAKSVSLRATESGNVLGLWSVLAGV
jgi:hypothetical protein